MSIANVGNSASLNENNRTVVTLVGTGMTAKQWTKALRVAGHKVGSWAHDIFSGPDYDEKHRLEKGKPYRVVLVRGSEIPHVIYRTSENLKAIAVKEFGEQSVSRLKAELSILLRMKFSNADLERMGLWYMLSLHEPIVDSQGDNDMLGLNRYEGNSLLDVYVDNTAVKGNKKIYGWNYGGAFAFLLE